MIMNWQDLVNCYGEEIDGYREHFAEAGETTYGLLCCCFAPSNARLAASGGEHSERKLLGSPLWSHEIPAALQAWTPLQRSPIVVTMVINRSPCRSCTGALEAALRSLQWRFAAGFEKAHFLLACRGAYQGKVTSAGYYEHSTTIGGLNRLQKVGWNLCVLQVGNSLAPSGRQLLEAVRSLSPAGYRFAQPS